MVAGMNADVRCDRRGEPRAGRGDPVGRGHALPAVSGCAAPVRDRLHPHRARRRGRHRDRDPAAGPLQRLLATRVLLPAELMVRRADSTEVIGNVLVAKSRGAGYGKHRRPLRASRVDRPPIVAGRARAALAVALPPQRRPCGPGRPGSCWSGRRTVADIVLAATRAGCWLLAGCDRLIDPSDGSRGLLSAVRDVHEFTNRGMMRLFIAVLPGDAHRSAQTGLLSLLGLSDHEDTPHRRLLSGVGGSPGMSVRLSRPDERVRSLT